MKTKKLLVAIAILAMLFSGFTTPATVSADWSKVDQRVRDQIDAHGTAEFIAILTEQADFSDAARLDGKVEKTTYVYNQLIRTAAETQSPLLAYLQAQGVTYKSFYIQNMIEVTAGRSTVEWLAARPDVARIVPLPDPRPEPVIKNLPMTQELPGPQLPSSAEYGPSQSPEAVEWNITRVGAPDVWAMGFHGEGMVVASNDTGVDYTHPALVGKYRGNNGDGSFDHNYNWWDGNFGFQYPYDYDGHGTHTTGTMVGDDGGSNQIGMAPGAKWIACGGLGGTDPIDCFQFFLTPWNLNGQNPDPSKAPDAINNSWYDPSGFDYRPIIQALNAAGIAVIKSAGNNGSGCSTITNPGYVPEIIATAAFGQGDIIAYFSSRGPSSYYGETILKPEVAAPGVNVRSSVPGGGYEGGWSGTSMAAPHSTGLVALIWGAATCIRGDVPLTKQIMMETAEAKIDTQCGPFVDHPNDVWGWGILDAQAAVQSAMTYCGGMGGLEGNVTSGGLPVEGVNVYADGMGGFSRSDITDLSGFYSMRLLSDTYTVTASLFGYQPVEIPGVGVVGDVTTTLDIDITPLPISGLTATNDSPTYLGDPTHFVAAVEAGTPPIDYQWDFGDGTTGAGQETAHTYGAVGEYTAIVTATNSVSSQTTSTEVTITDVPIAGLVASNDSPTELGGTTHLTATITAGSNVSYTWDFGDGTTGSGPTNGHIYPEVGIYTAIVTATNGTNNASADTGVIIIDVPIQGLTASNNSPTEIGGTTQLTATITAGTNVSFVWDFGDGTTGTGQVNEHVYPDVGSYTAIVTATNGTNNASADTGVVIIDVPIQGLVALNSGPTEVGSTTLLTATVSAGTHVSYVWDFGDGTTGTGPANEHIYPDVGTYTAIVTATNGTNNASADTEVAITDVPIQGLAASNDSPTELGNPTHFTAIIGAGTQVTYAWDFGDGSFGSGENPSHIYADPGSYTAIVTASNAIGSESATTLVTITDVPIQGLAAENDSPTLLGNITTFTASVTAGTHVVYTWDFGDETTAVGQVVEHIYAAVGEYTAILTATNLGDSATVETIASVYTIQPPVYYIYLPVTPR